MSRKLDNADWEQYINKVDSYKNTVTVKDFCIENDFTKSQFYYHKKRLEKANPIITKFHEVSLKTEKANTEQVLKVSKEIKITIGNANIVIPASETVLIYSIIKELAEKC
jgi:hypothetical protein